MSQARARNAAWLLLENRQRPGQAYLLTLQGSWSYEKVWGEVSRLAGFFVQLGLEPGARVALIMGDRVDLVLGFWAALWSGMVAVPLAPVLSPLELRQVLVDCQPSVILTEPSTAGRAAAATEGLGTSLFVCDEPPFWASSSQLPEPVKVSGAALALLLYTSGTTGRMKGVAHTHASVIGAAQGLGPQVLKLAPEDRVFSASRMFFAYGLGNSVYIPAACGATVAVHPGPILPGAVAEVFDRFHPSVFFAVPSLYEGLLGIGWQPRSLRLAVSAGEKLPEDLWRRLTRRLGVPVLDGLGMTETLHHVTSNLPSEMMPGSAGKPLAGFDVRVTGEGGEELGPEEVGELWVSGPTLMAGYWNQPELTARVLVDGWLRTGDLVSLRGGFLFTHGRRDELIKIGGLAVYPGEVEAVLRQHPAVAEAAVVPLSRGAGVVILKAFVVLKAWGAIQETELYRHCRRHLASYKVPRVYEVVDTLPRTTTGKLQRGRLAAETWG